METRNKERWKIKLEMENNKTKKQRKMEPMENKVGENKETKKDGKQRNKKRWKIIKQRKMEL